MELRPHSRCAPVIADVQVKSMPLNSECVPEEVRALMPLAARWNIGDDFDREQAVASAPTSELSSLVAVLEGSEGEFLYNWLSGPESYSPKPTREYLALTHMTMAADSAKLKLRERK